MRRLMPFIIGTMHLAISENANTAESTQVFHVGHCSASRGRRTSSTRSVKDATCLGRRPLFPFGKNRIRVAFATGSLSDQIYNNMGPGVESFLDLELRKWPYHDS
ncbi:uncharacterized protein LOC112494203 [Cephus cinctus]|uniref:Uncharacterized protein LOC112494203 n=1 Tax=Cephus cinctus TaxID=211228 RepID=A0AAJ7RFT3_CEPCN|nr:uncharacterized protein LOC112494203 [Cephus cinctus]